MPGQISRQIMRGDTAKAGDPGLQPTMIGVGVWDMPEAVAAALAGAHVDRFVVDAALAGDGGEAAPAVAAQEAVVRQGVPDRRPPRCAPQARRRGCRPGGRGRPAPGPARPSGPASGLASRAASAAGPLVWPGGCASAWSLCRSAKKNASSSSTMPPSASLDATSARQNRCRQRKLVDLATAPKKALWTVSPCSNVTTLKTRRSSTPG